MSLEIKKKPLCDSQIEEKVQGEVMVRFMKSVGDGTYNWPQIDDKALVPLYDIIRVLPDPIFITRGRGFSYKFDIQTQ